MSSFPCPISHDKKIDTDSTTPPPRECALGPTGQLLPPGSLALCMSVEEDSGTPLPLALEMGVRGEVAGGGGHLVKQAEATAAPHDGRSVMSWPDISHLPLIPQDHPSA